MYKVRHDTVTSLNNVPTGMNKQSSTNTQNTHMYKVRHDTVTDLNNVPTGMNKQSSTEYTEYAHVQSQT